MVYRGKGGSYNSGQRAARAGLGRVLIAFKSGGIVVQRAFSYGHFYNCEDCRNDAATGDAYGKAAIEKFRPAIRSAVASW